MIGTIIGILIAIPVAAFFLLVFAMTLGDIGSSIKGWIRWWRIHR